MRKATAVLDANVLYGSFIRDVMLSLFAAEMYEARWTDQITDEWVRHLTANRPDVTPEKVAKTVNAMNRISPNALVSNYEKYIGQITIPDVDDRHVVAAAIACSAQKIVTWNLSDFPNNILKTFGVVAESPDTFVLGLLIEDHEGVIEVLRGMRLRFKAPPVSVDGFFEKLRKNNFRLTTKFLERYRELL